MTIRLFSSIVFACVALSAEAAELPTADLYVQPAACPGAANPERCKWQVTTFTEDHASALVGDYQAQRNVAYCLKSGCDGAIRQEPVTACAWRIVILASGSFSVDASDEGNFNVDCGALSSSQQRRALTQAGTLYKAIYKKSLPREFGG